MNAYSKATELVHRSYNRMALIYDLMEGRAKEGRFHEWRRLLWSKAEGNNILEVGVGTGYNFPFYPKDDKITAIDLSEKMLARAREKTEKQGLKVKLQQMDVQNLEFKDETFDSVVESLVFCSVPDPVKGLKEIKRVCRPGGKVLLMEHVLAANRFLAFLMKLANPITVAIMRENINRRTVDDVARSGLRIEKVVNLSDNVFRLIEARKEF